MKVQYLLDEKEFLDHLTNNMTPPESDTTAQHRRDEQTYGTWFKRNRTALFTMLSYTHDDLMGRFEKFLTAKELWEQLRV